MINKSSTDNEVQDSVVLKKSVMECFKDHKDALLDHDAKIQKIEEIITELQKMMIGKMRKHSYISRTPSGKRLKLDEGHLMEKVFQMERFLIYIAFVTLVIIGTFVNSVYTEKWK